MLLALLCLAAAGAAAAQAPASRPVVVAGPLAVCTPDAGCRPASLFGLTPRSGELVLIRRVSVAPGALPTDRPIMVRVIALASSEVRWNGTVIGTNGRPAATREGEIPGRLVATFMVPAELVRTGDNRVSVRLSSHHLILPVHNRVHAFDVAPYWGEALPGLDHYLPSLLLAGALAVAAAYFGAAALSDRGDRRARLLAGAALAGIGQLALETVRAFVNYPYPWHLPRLLGVAAFAAAAAILLTAYAARRFTPRRARAILGAVTAAAVASIVLFPWFDIKALGAIVAGLGGVLACALPAARRRPDARVAAALATAGLALIALQGFQFLDQGWYAVLALALILLVVEQVRVYAAARRALEQRLSRLANAADETVLVKDGARTHRLAETAIVAIRAADDYCELRLTDGRTVLATTTLSRLLAQLSDRFVRIHRSHAVNRAHVTLVTGRGVALSDGSELPVGRSYLRAAAELRGKAG